MFHTKMSLKRMFKWSLLASLVLVALIGGMSAAMAATAPSLLSNDTYGIVSSTFTNSNLAPYTIINGNACWTTPPASVPTTITGTTLVPCGASQIADQSSALATMNGQTCTAIGAGVDLGAVSIDGGTPGVIPPGCYYATGAINIGSVVHLHGAGVYVFRSAALGTAANSTVFLDNGACANNVFWAPAAATTLAANSTFSGTIIDDAGITIGANSLVTGRLMASGGTITINSDTVTVPGACSSTTTSLGLLTTVSGGSAVTGDFTLKALGDSTTGPTLITGTSPVTAALAPVGVYALTETTTKVGYTPAFSCSGGGTLVGNNLTISSADAGKTITCTIANTYTGNSSSLGLVKSVVNTGGGTATAAQFMLTATGNSATGPTLITGTTPVAATNAPVGVYTLTETGPTGYTASYSCSGGGTLVGNILTTTTADAGNTITCTITNTYTNNSSVNLGLRKTVVNTGGGTATAGQFTLTATGDSTTGPTVISGTTPVANAIAPLGVYTLTETGPSGYTASYSCSGGGTLSGNKLAITSADAGNTIICTITNTYTNSSSVNLGLQKTVVNTGGGTATAGQFMLTATGDSTTGPTVISGISPVANAIAPLGVYTLTETGPTGYTPSYSCSGGGTLSGNKLAITSADAGKTITCTITNTYTNGTLVNLGLRKTVVNTGGGTAKAGQFMLTATGDGATGPTTITGTTPVANAIAPVGVYTLTETGPTGYTASYTCSGGGTLSGNMLAITSADVGKTITCTIMNTYTSTGNVVLAISKAGKGGGKVTSSDSLINCGDNCSAQYTPPISTTLTATATSGSTFAGWSGGSCSGTGTCAVSSSSDLTITATFNALLKGDFFGKGRAEIVWRNYPTGDNVIWDTSGYFAPIKLSSNLPNISDNNWEVVGVGNFGGGAETDILWRHKTYGYNVVWHMTSGVYTSLETLPTITDNSWKIVGTGNFSGTGYTDIVWRNSDSGANVMWHMSGTTINSETVLPTLTDTNWIIAGMGDFKGDNTTTIIWRHQLYGYNAYWFMNGATVTTIGMLPTVADLNWEIGGIADFDGSGNPSIVWRHKIYGYNVIWFMNGTAVKNIKQLPQISDPNWKIVGTK
ncbi:MAG: DUF3494 domain-containing protein [Candidatus Magnetominusculus sp. LBB02]|nr:DUF3494 domain-containing protein [Candidatus Magnetominusculus sp. LBB02]